MGVLNDYRRWSGDLQEFQEWINELKREYRKEEYLDSRREEQEYEFVSDCCESGDYDY